jgi:penicillin-binding protein 2
MFGFRLSSKRRKKQTKDIEPHEIFMDGLAQKREEEIGVSNRKFEVSLSTITLRFFSFFIFFLFLFLFGRSFQLQIVEGNRYSEVAQKNILSIAKRQLLRGVIYDRNHNQLVYNAPQYDLYFRKMGTLNKKNIAEISKIIDREEEDLLKEINDNTGLIIVKRDLNHEELIQIEARKDDFPELSIISTAGREYIDGEIFAHILGYIGKIDKETLKNNPEKYTIHDYVGLAGIEKFYENILTRAGDEIQVEKDVAGNVISEKTVESSEEGKNIILTIDARLQRIVFEKAKENLEKIGAKNTAIVALDPRNGEVLAMVSLPSFDNNLFRKNTDKKLFAELFQNKEGVLLNRVISSTYPTGSVIKPLLAASALEEGIITPEKRINSLGYISIPNPWNPSQPTIFKDFKAHGWRDMREAIGVSSNVYFYSIGGGYEDQEGLGAERMKKYLSLFGWGSKTGIDLSGEKEGFLPSPEWKKETIGDAWRIGDSYNMSIGQGYLSATPIQVANAFASIVNGGKLFVPQIVKEIIDDEGNVLEKKESQIIRENFISPENLQVSKEGMEQATIIGTAVSLQVLPIKVGAKTGTAETSRPGINNNWVSVFAPYDNPEIVITVIIENVVGVTPVATHLARDILMEYFSEEGGEIDLSN